VTIVGGISDVNELLKFNTRTLAFEIRKSSFTVVS